MKQIEDNIVAVKSYAFALRCVDAYKFLTDRSNPNAEYILSKQMLRSGTSIGANIREAIQAQSKADFGTKMNISLKEANENIYWLELLRDSGYLTQNQADALINDCTEVLKILSSIVKTTFSK